MDQIKIGKWIAKERKRKNYTQKQLAEILGISDKTISKWECGNGFPEISLLLPLCKELDMSVNELLSGERLSLDEYKKKAEENMVDFIKEKENNKKKMQLTVITGVSSTVAFLTLIMVVSVYTEVISAQAKALLVVIACVIFGSGLYVAMQGERTIGYYKCKNCGEYFVPTFVQYTMGVHFFATRRLKCPHCGKTGWCKKVMGKEEN